MTLERPTGMKSNSEHLDFVNHLHVHSFRRNIASCRMSFAGQWKVLLDTCVQWRSLICLQSLLGFLGCDLPNAFSSLFEI